MQSPKSGKVYKITNWVKLTNKQYHSKLLLNSFAMNGHNLIRLLFVELKVRKLCINQGFTLGVKQTAPLKSTAQHLCNEWSHFRLHEKFGSNYPFIVLYICDHNCFYNKIKRNNFYCKIVCCPMDSIVIPFIFYSLFHCISL